MMSRRITAPGSGSSTPAASPPKSSGSWKPWTQTAELAQLPTDRGVGHGASSGEDEGDAPSADDELHFRKRNSTTRQAAWQSAGSDPVAVRGELNCTLARVHSKHDRAACMGRFRGDDDSDGYEKGKGIGYSQASLTKCTELLDRFMAQQAVSGAAAKDEQLATAHIEVLLPLLLLPLLLLILVSLPQLLGFACLFVATKAVEVDIAPLEDIVRYCCSYSR